MRKNLHNIIDCDFADFAHIRETDSVYCFKANANLHLFIKNFTRGSKAIVKQAKLHLRLFWIKFFVRGQAIVGFTKARLLIRVR